MTIDYDALALDYAQHRQVHPRVLRSLVSTGEQDGGSRVLEAGCGTGNYAIALAETVGCSCWGTEPSAQMVSRAGQRSRAARFTQGKAEQLGYADGSFDLVFSVDVIHHVEEPSRYFASSHRVLKEGGRICTVTDSDEMVRRRRPLSVYFPETVDADLGRYPREAELREMLIRAGFTGLREEVVELAYSVSDVQPYRDRAFSCLHLIPAQAFERGLRRMERDLESGPVQGVGEYCLVWGTKKEMKK
jgi:ubiquinone/menaquinone biosynthesis C-methylase UbiE